MQVKEKVGEVDSETYLVARLLSNKKSKNKDSTPNRVTDKPRMLCIDIHKINATISSARAPSVLLWIGDMQNTSRIVLLVGKRHLGLVVGLEHRGRIQTMVKLQDREHRPRKVISRALRIKSLLQRAPANRGPTCTSSHIE